MPLFDLSLPISPQMVTWPGDPPVLVEPQSRIRDGRSANVSRLCLGSHTGTHVDAPYHFCEQGLRLDEIALEMLTGPAWVCELTSVQTVTIEDLRDRVPLEARRLLLKTENSSLWHTGQSEFVSDFVVLEPGAAAWLVQRGIRLLGVDYLSVERPDTLTHPVHHTLLGAGVIIVEGLDLSCLCTGWYNLCCLPLKVTGGDGAPARVVADGPLQ